MKGANYLIVDDRRDWMIIRDVGPWDHYATVTNAAEGVVAELHARGVLPVGKMLLYYDSEYSLDQLLHNGLGGFMGFAPAPADAVEHLKKVDPRQIAHQS